MSNRSSKKNRAEPPRVSARPLDADLAAPRSSVLRTLEARAAGLPVADEAHLFWEDRVADSLGLSRERVRELREKHFATPEHFVVGPANAICLTPTGLALLTLLTGPGAAGLAPAPLAAPAPATPAPFVPSGPPRRAELIVHTVPRNPRLLICRAAAPDTPGPTLVVRVRDNALFMPGMRVPCIECPGNLWQHHGRMPRRKGRW